MIITMQILLIVSFGCLIAGLLIHYKLLASRVDGSLSDPVTGKWSPKITTAFLFVIIIAIIELVWLKKAFLTDNFTGMELILGFNFAYIVAAYGMKMAEKMQVNKLDSKKEPAANTTEEEKK